MPVQVPLVYAHRDAVLTHVSAVASGLACGCGCCACGGRLIAKKGPVRHHHFAHHREVDCPHAAETALHLAAKAALVRRREIALPAVCLGPGYVAGPAFAPARRHAIEHVRTEVHLGDVVPDLIVWIAGRDVYVEIRVTHAVDDAKTARLAARGVSTVEIDLSDAARDLSPAEVERLVIDDAEGKRWVVNASADAARRAALPRSRLIPTENVAGRARVTYCPVHARRWGMKGYAEVIDDCEGCAHCMAIGPGDAHVRCVGHLASLAYPRGVRECRRLYAVA